MAHTFIVLSTIYADQLVVSPDAGALSLSNTIKSTSTYLTTIHFSSFFFFYSFRGIVIVQSLRYFYTLDHDHLSFIIINTRPIRTSSDREEDF